MLIIQALMFPKMIEIRCAGYSNKMVINNQQQLQ
uniref:Uncharacterized protein n=1 Tax=Elaeophora elaphi TaxID=1147741 RepID=A0A0R3RFI1_9BILA